MIAIICFFLLSHVLPVEHYYQIDVFIMRAKLLASNETFVNNINAIQHELWVLRSDFLCQVSILLMKWMSYSHNLISDFFIVLHCSYWPLCTNCHRQIATGFTCAFRHLTNLRSLSSNNSLMYILYLMFKSFILSSLNWCNTGGLYIPIWALASFAIID